MPSLSGWRYILDVSSLRTFFLYIFVAICISIASNGLVAGNSILHESAQGWQTLSDHVVPDSNFVMIPKYYQNNFAQMVLGAKFAREFVVSRSSQLAAPQVVDWYPDRILAREDQTAMVNDATRLNASAVMIANNAGSGVTNATKAAKEAGLVVVSYDSPIPGGYDAGEALFVTGVDFTKTGIEMAKMALSILGDEGGDFCIMSTTKDATNMNGWIESMREALKSDSAFERLNLVDVFWPKIDNAEGYTELALEIVELQMNGTYPDLSLIMAPTTSGSAAAARALLENGHCGRMRVSGLSVPAEMLEATEKGCAPEFALFSNLDLGYLAYMATHAIASGAIEGKAGDIVDAGRLGKREIKADTARGENSTTLLLGDFIRYNEANVERAAFVDCVQGYCGDSEDFFEERFVMKYKKRALAIIPKVTGAISFVCSTYLVVLILSSQKSRGKTYKRLICGLSLTDMITSFFGFFLSTWPMPADSFLSWGARGSMETCEMQGFLFQLGILATPLYGVVLATYYLLVVAFGWKDDKLKRIEWVLHLIPWTFGLGTAVAGLVLGLYNPSSRGSICWIEEYPPYCSSSMTCERGQNYGAYRWGFLYAFVIFALFWLSFCMLRVWKTVLDQEKKLDRYTSRYRRKREIADRKHSRATASQGLYYVFAFILPWVWGILLFLIDDERKIFEYRTYDDAITWLHIVNAVIFPLQGLFNVLVYVRPRYNLLRQRHQNLTTREFITKELFSSLSRRSVITRRSVINRDVATRSTPNDFIQTKAKRRATM